MQWRGRFLRGARYVVMTVAAAQWGLASEGPDRCRGMFRDVLTRVRKTAAFQELACRARGSVELTLDVDARNTARVAVRAKGQQLAITPEIACSTPRLGVSDTVGAAVESALFGLPESEGCQRR